MTWCWRRLRRRQLPCSICCPVTRPRLWRCCGPAEDGWSAEDWQVFFDERAGIVEFDGGTAAGGGRGPGLCLLRRRMAEPQSGALAGRALFRLW